VQRALAGHATPQTSKAADKTPAPVPENGAQRGEESNAASAPAPAALIRGVVGAGTHEGGQGIQDASARADTLQNKPEAARANRPASASASTERVPALSEGNLEASKQRVPELSKGNVEASAPVRPATASVFGRTRAGSDAGSDAERERLLADQKRLARERGRQASVP
jgi:hypothetical protein